MDDADGMIEYRSGCIAAHLEAASNGSWIYYRGAPLFATRGNAVVPDLRLSKGPNMRLNNRVEPPMMAHALIRWSKLFCHGFAGAYDYTFTNNVVTDDVCCRATLNVRCKPDAKIGMFSVLLDVKVHRNVHDFQDYILSGFRSAEFEYHPNVNQIKWSKSQEGALMLTLQPPLSTIDVHRHRNRRCEGGGEVVVYDDAVISYYNDGGHVDPYAYEVRVDVAKLLGATVAN
jgi:hypothetical protein